jgi:ribosome-binding factor A
MKRHSDKPKSGPTGPSQRQLRAGELIRHALVDILREEELQDEALTGVTITVSEVRMSPDLRHAVCFVEPLGAGLAGQAAGQNVDEIIKGLNRVSKFLRGRLGRSIDMKFTPDLKFLHDESFGTAAYMDKLFLDPRVRQDTERRLSDVLDDEGDIRDED